MFDRTEEAHEFEQEEPRSNRKSRTPRMLLAVGATTVLGAGILGGAALLRGDGGVTTPPVEWEAIVIADRLTGDLSLLDETGSVLAGATLPSFGGVDRLVTGAGDIAARSGVDLFLNLFADDPPTVPLPPGAALRAIQAPGAGTVLIGGTGDDLTITSLSPTASSPARTLSSITGEPTPRYPVADVRADASGTMLAVPDATNFQTVVVNLSADTITYFPDLPLALRGDLVVTAQRVGDRMELGLFAASGERLRTVPTEVIVGGTIPPSASRFVFITRGGEIWSARPTQSDAERIGAISGPSMVTSVRAALDGRRLVVGSEGVIAVVDVDGESVLRRESPGILDEGTDVASRCMTLRLGTTIELIDLDNGALITSVSDVDVTARSHDGCLLAVNGPSGAALVGSGGVTPVGGSVLAVAPDSSAAIVSESGVLSLVRYRDGIDEIVTLNVRGDLAEFVAS
ncbi:MAG: hypothetical protein ACO37U_09615 [Ilumatobacteraceae bacterium]